MDAAGPRHYPDKPAKVYLFGTCLIDMFCPEAGMDALRLLEREGNRGAFSGRPDLLRAAGAQQWLSRAGTRRRPGAVAALSGTWPVIVPSGSCAGTMRHHYPEMFADDPRLQAEASCACRAGVRTQRVPGACCQSQSGRPGCAGTRRLAHFMRGAARDGYARARPRELLAQLGAVEVVMHEHESECCGFGGTFSLKHPAISSAMAGDKVDALKETGAETFLSADCGCMLSLNHTLAEAARWFSGQHLATFLWQRTSGEGGQQ
jgi:L-lactate dehydrogenase complex protein LldE